MIFNSCKWIIFFIFLISFHIKANSIFVKKNNPKKIQNFFLIPTI
ncbi:hypothetical protein CWS_02955 [Buchnera aphidicola str. JF99 (Acyrthosiphon pisum)]|nr:hypothetical protein CWO_03010 [Buchnera aphidicola str. LL01 (Acyrthosiphon pisum)]ADP66951.1 hypothetical protein CWQ_03055 [Buchnera aphidicola str. TLW03 (Acyrthosiphon pisum)]ADP67539.1 hypothetical protein CWS_02955 [Buchnera aphidicola str. JF99 (Acyrthosiphon pisum)]ADP68023.1 hypothetical protein CWU_03705 [Buchnera aphidicola str. JF98 (Acyrthosiphon pisum)]